MKKYNKKAQMNKVTMTILIMLSIAVVVGLTWGLTGGFGGNTLSTIGVEESDGEFDDSQLPEEVGGTDLIINTSFAVSSEAFTVAYETDVDLNGTDGNNHIFAYNFEVSSGNLDDFSADIELSATIATTELVLKNAYIMQDEKGLTLDSANALSNFIVDVDTDLDKIEIESDFVEDGEYILVIEAKSLATITIAAGESLMTVDMDAQSDDSDATDEGIVTIYNNI
jgi:hypothetical protein